ncbi:hypothetical protein GOV09_03780 [Candidatus Woesearchaeota archaeon]|nr:hypothetical protein [Candidatus Woesearchaeota archaeon]
MEIRNIQRTGKMHYVYLPTSWCKKFKINSDTKIAVRENADGSLLITPELKEKGLANIDLTVPSKYKDALINIIMACYVNPTHSFNIKLDKKIDMTSILEQKHIISALEFVELDGEHVTYESSMTIHEPDSLLKTMVKKIKNLFYVFIEKYDAGLIQKYEEEIDRSKILIQKSVISALVLNQPTTLKSIDMYYTVQLATELERIVDYSILLDPKDKAYLQEVLKIVEKLKDVLENINDLDYIKGASFMKTVLILMKSKGITIKNFNKYRISRLFHSIGEIILDWSISKKIEN